MYGRSLQRKVGYMKKKFRTHFGVAGGTKNAKYNSYEQHAIFVHELQCSIRLKVEFLNVSL